MEDLERVAKLEAQHQELKSIIDTQASTITALEARFAAYQAQLQANQP